MGKSRFKCLSIGMSDRLLIMKDGKITKEFQRSKELSDRDIINYMI